MTPRNQFFLVMSGNQGCCIIFSIFSGVMLNLFGTYLQRKTGNICICKRNNTVSLEDIIIGVVTTKRHLLNIIVYMLIIGKVYLQALRASKTQLSIYGTFA